MICENGFGAYDGLAIHDPYRIEYLRNHIKAIRRAIDKLVEDFKEGNQFETLLGVTGSGKTFIMANIIQRLQKPTLIIAHNKTLAAQLYGEMKEFFPNNTVEYFVSWCAGVGK